MTIPSAPDSASVQQVNQTEIPPEVRYGQVQCTKCLKFNAIQSLRCRSCGLPLGDGDERVARPLSRAAALKAPLRTVTSSRLTELWDRVVENYESELRHQEFVLTAFNLGCLHFAAQKYARILSASPSEGLALKMQTQIEALASRDAVRVLPIEPSGYSNKIPVLIMVSGITVMVLGFLLPQSRNLVGVGCSIMVVAGGLRYLLSR